MAEQTLQSPEQLDTPTRLAFDRTRVAYERTMMAWIRTRDFADHLRLQYLQVLSARSAACAPESPNWTARLRLHIGKHRTLLTDPGNP